MPQIQVAGTVNSIAWEGKRIQIWERFESNGKDFSRLWTCWFSESQAWNLQEQDWAEIHGELSTKIGSYKTKDGVEKTVVEHHIQAAQLVQVKSAQDQAAHAAKVDEGMPF
jgi:hypothetical protein